MNKTLLIVILSAAVLIIGAFFGGMVYGKNQIRSRSLGNIFDIKPGGFGTSTTERMNNRNGAGMTMGEIISKDSESITIKTQDGGSKIILFSDLTQIAKSTSGSIDDLEIGKTIGVSGTSNTDGSITAKNISLQNQIK